MSLFREEALSHQREGLTGSITLTQPLSIKVTVLIFVGIALLIITFLCTAKYSRKETVRGFLMPNKGVIQSFATQGGTIEQLFVKEGDIVAKSQVLATIVVKQGTSQGVELSTHLTKQLRIQYALLHDEIKQIDLLQQQEILNLEKQQDALSDEKKAIQQQLLLVDEKLELLASQQSDFNTLNQRGFLSSIERDQHKQAVLEARQEKQNLSRLLMQTESQLSQLSFSLINAPKRYTLQVNSLKRDQAQIQNQLLQVASNYQYTVTASNSGVVTGIQVVEGEVISQAMPLLHIIPEGSELVAELLLPTRSAGFIALGNDTRLRFDAFPYQRFGFINSKITRIDKALITPNEVRMPIALQEPVYRLRAKLISQKMTAYGKEFDLKSGMLFEADIMLEQRTLIEWLLEPIYSLKGRVS